VTAVSAVNGSAKRKKSGTVGNSILELSPTTAAQELFKNFDLGSNRGSIMPSENPLSRKTSTAAPQPKSRSRSKSAKGTKQSMSLRIPPKKKKKNEDRLARLERMY